MTWRELRVFVTYLPRDSALWREIYGDDSQWGLPEQLLAAIADGIHAGNWQRGGDSKAKRPKRIPRPGVSENEGKAVRRIGGDVVRSPAEIDALLARASSEEVTPSPSNSPPPT